MRPSSLALTLLLALPPLAGFAGEITLTQAWSRATAGSAMPGIAFLTITDQGAGDRIIGISTPIADEAALHQSHEEAGVSSMEMLTSLAVPAGATLSLAPGGTHIMLMGLKHALKAGDSFPLTLEFEHAGKITTQVSVKAIGALRPD